MFKEYDEQLKADRAFKRANKTQKISFLKAPVVVKPSGERFRIATQSVTDDNGTTSRRSLARI